MAQIPQGRKPTIDIATTTTSIGEEINSLPPSFYLHLRGDEIRPTHPVEHPSRIVLLHGYMQTHTCWLTTAHRLRSRYGHSVLLIDFYGHGRSPWLKDYTQFHSTTLAHQVRQVLEQVRWTTSPVCFTSISLGGAVAQQYLLMYPENVERILLLASAGLSEPTMFSPS